MNSLHTIFIIFMAMVNSSPENTVLYGEPAIISATISYSNQYIDEYLEMEKGELNQKLSDSSIVKEQYDSELDIIDQLSEGVDSYILNKKESWNETFQIQLFEDSTKRWIPFPWKTHFLEYGPDENQIEIHDGMHIAFEWGIDPEIVSTISEGNYIIRFSTEVEKNGVSYPIYSESSIIKMTGESYDTEDYNSLTTMINYFTKRQNFDKAKSFSNKLLTDNPNDVAGLTLLGNIYSSMKDYEKALDIYFKAAAEFDKLGAPPEDKLYIIDQINYVQSLMEN